MGKSGYRREVEHRTEAGRPLTVRVSWDGKHELRACGHLSPEDMDKAAGTDHVHIFETASGAYQMHDMRSAQRMHPNMPDVERDRADDKRALIAEARSILTGTLNRAAIDRAKELQQQFSSIGRSNPDLRSEFRQVMDAIFAASKTEAEQRKRERETSRQAKEQLVSRAEAAALSVDTKQAGDEIQRLFDEWKRIGRCARTDEDRLWGRFQSARKRLAERKSQDWEKRKREWAANKSTKERIVAQAESQASASDLRAASERMRQLGDELKKVGPCEKSDNERLWERFSRARTRLSERKKQQFESRQREWDANKRAKDSLISQMRSLASSSDLRAAKEQARNLDAHWRTTGPCAKADADRLWEEYRSAKDRLWAAAKADGERRRTEAMQRAQERVWRLNEQFANVEMAIRRAEESLSRALSARPPSMRNPNWSRISASQLERQSNARAKLASLQVRRSDVIQKLGEARSRLSQF